MAENQNINDLRQLKEYLDTLTEEQLNARPAEYDIYDIELVDADKGFIIIGRNFDDYLNQC